MFMESLHFEYPFDCYDMEDVTLLAKKCSKSLLSLNIFPERLRKFRQVFKHATKLDHFGYRGFDEDEDYSGFEFPSNIHGLRIEDLTEVSFPFLRPYLNQLRDLHLKCVGIEPNCQCYFFKRCPGLEVLHTKDICGDEGLKVIGQFCKKLRKLTHHGRVTQKGLIAVAQGTLKNLRDFCIYLDEEGGKIDFPLDNAVRAMLRGCKKLERLDIHLCPGVLTDVGLGFIGEYGRNIRHLSLSNTGESDVGLLELLKGYVWLDYVFPDVLVLTRPMVSVQVLTELYLKLAGILHRLALQLVADGSDAGSVKITYTSSRVKDDIDTPLIRNMVANSIRNEERYTSGGTSEKPFEIIVRIANVESRFTSAVSEFGDIKLQGRVTDGVPHLMKVGAFEVDVSLDSHILLCRQVDELNTIGSVASILGKENVNISTMSVYRAAPRKEAVMVIAVDEKPSEEALKKIDEIPAVEDFVFLAL
nr:hypothetical protein [Tanacetum cinerariifolium]